MNDFGGRVEILFFAYRVEDLRRGFRAAAKAITENGIDAHNRGSVVVPLDTPVLWAPGSVMTAKPGFYPDSRPVLEDNAIQLSLVNAEVWASTVDDVVSILRSRSLFYLEPPDDRSPDAQLSPWCSGELRAGDGHNGNGLWWSRWIDPKI